MPKPINLSLIPSFLLLCWNQAYSNEEISKSFFDMNIHEVSRINSRLRFWNYYQNIISEEDGRKRPNKTNVNSLINEVQNILKLQEQDVTKLKEISSLIKPRLKDVQDLFVMPTKIVSNKQIPLITISYCVILKEQKFLDLIEESIENISGEENNFDFSKFQKHFQAINLKMIFEEAINPELSKQIREKLNVISGFELDTFSMRILRKLNAGILFYSFFPDKVDPFDYNDISE